MFNIITTYYNDPYLLENFLEKNTRPDIKVIIVDDGSQKYPARDVLKVLGDISNIELYTIPIDYGFNSHGARNLGMHITDTEWNLLLDLDIECDVQYAIDMHKSDMTIYYGNHVRVDRFGDMSSELSIINNFMISKKLFWSVNGYDEEFTGHHYGDGMFAEAIGKIGTIEYCMGFQMRTVYKTPYDQIKKREESINSRDTLKLKDLHLRVRDRISSMKFEDKKVLNFEWYREL